MIQAKELRVGNLLQCQLFTNGEWRTIEVTGLKVMSNGRSFLSWRAPDHDCGDLVMLNEGYRGIPNTNGWLEKAGFEESTIYKGCYSKQWQNLAFWWEDDSVWIEDFVSEGMNNFMEPKFIHQLQNLYFVLTKEELTIIL